MPDLIERIGLIAVVFLFVRQSRKETETKLVSGLGQRCADRTDHEVKDTKSQHLEGQAHVSVVVKPV